MPMSDPHWTSYVGMASGIFGALAGIAGAIMGYIGYRKSKDIKSLDLRLELRKAVVELQASYSELDGLIDRSHRSRTIVAAARGRHGTGEMDEWNRNVEIDRATIAQLSDAIPNEGEEFKNLNTEELESKLVDIHKTQGEVNQIRDRYNAAMIEDDRQRDHLRSHTKAAKLKTVGTRSQTERPCLSQR